MSDVDEFSDLEVRSLDEDIESIVKAQSLLKEVG
jgi:hypothetical protein